MATTARNVRVPDDRWEEAKAILGGRGTTVSAYLNAKLEELVVAERARRAFVDGLELPDVGTAA